ncbi:hypothetical protein COEREDRAFT_88015 [Coemansia reversa NRRL 1564]|uniref:Uncharacterized protein n=1 Tax=Coemansia reversa (strain ATCC 12441 / NRRL 1564) TaxID=763665 RepID=A0A2G5B827_COERN|nr:hypothetical protein COEREDRAFT_88015 [Coemansia reversa NRRL 1564]|eukprot:PIA15155.1 hypothetical protein COEREDRAFT_88015 [Coemansia reversa NRRL 1564]
MYPSHVTHGTKDGQQTAHLKLTHITTIALLACASSSCLAHSLGPRQVAGVGAVATTTPADAGAIAPVDTVLTPAQAGVEATPLTETAEPVAGEDVLATPAVAEVPSDTTPAHDVAPTTTLANDAPTTPTPAAAPPTTTKPSKITPTPTPTDTPTTTKQGASTTSPEATTPAVPAPGGLGAAGGGGGDQPALTSEPDNVYTATKGSGGILEYGSCLEFENQCNSLCTEGIYSMNCVDGGLCLCYEKVSSDSANENDGSKGGNASATSDSFAARQLSAWGLSAIVILVATEAWIISGRRADAELPAISLAAALGTPSKPKRKLNFVKDATGDVLPRFAIAGSRDALPSLLEIKQRSGGRSTAIYLGIPATKLSNIDVIVLSRLDQMKLRKIGPARANLDNSVSTLLPLSGAKASPQNFALEPTVVVCIGKGTESAGYRMMKSDVNILYQQLLHIPSSRIRIVLPTELHQKERSVDSCRDEHPPRVVEILDYAQANQPPLYDVLASASHVIVTADDIHSVSLAVSLQCPVYIAGEERTTGLLRNYYHMLESKNLVRRFYPKGSRYSYMVEPDIIGKVDEFSAIRDHEPWGSGSCCCVYPQYI